MKQSVRLGTIRGIAVRVHWSVVLLLAIFAWELADYELPARPGHPEAGDWAAGVVGASVLLLSLLAHELSHALVARRHDVAVRSITLFVFGGVTRLEGEAHTPSADFRIAAAGPAASVALAGIFRGAEAMAALAVHGLVVATLSWLWEVNLLLAAFNVVPAAPLDGGRILRAALWRHWQDRARATLAAARFGRGFGFVLVVVGVLGLLYVGVTALWAALIGFFLYSAAAGEEQYARLQRALGGLTVAQVMTPDPPTARGSTTVADLLWHAHWPDRSDAVVVVDEHGTLRGVLTAQAVRRLRSQQLFATTVDQLAIPLVMVPVARPDDPADVLVERIVTHEGRPALVTDAGGLLVGVVSLEDVERAARWASRRR